MMSMAALQRGDVEGEIDGDFGWRAQALSYKIDEFKSLRRPGRAEHQLRAKFDIWTFT